MRYLKPNNAICAPSNRARVILFLKSLKNETHDEKDRRRDNYSTPKTHTKQNNFNRQQNSLLEAIGHLVEQKKRGSVLVETW